MKIAVTGKGGVGKTTFAATLARLYADEGKTNKMCFDFQRRGSSRDCDQDRYSLQSTITREESIKG